MIRNRILMISYILLSGILVSYSGGPASYLLFYFSILLPILAMAYIVYVYFRFRVYQYIDSKIIVKEEYIPYEFNLANEDIFAFTSVNVTFYEDISTVEKMNHNESYCLTPGESRKWETKMRCHYRGEYEVGIQKVIVTDFMKLFQLTYPCPSPIRVKVLPRVVELKQFVMTAKEDEKRNMELFQKNPVVPEIEVRPYAPGDSLRRIHWKATARKKELLTRQYVDEPKSEIVILMDLFRLKEEGLDRIIIEDKIIECALAITNYFWRHLIPTKVVYDDVNIKVQSIYGKANFDVFYKICSDITFRSNLSIGKMLSGLHGIQLSGNHYMMITHTLTEEDIIACYATCDAGNEITILYINDEASTELKRTLSGKARLFQITYHQDITEILDISKEG